MSPIVELAAWIVVVAAAFPFVFGLVGFILLMLAAKTTRRK